MPERRGALRTLEGVFLAAFSGICFGSMGVAAQVLFTRFGFRPQDLVSIRLIGAGAIMLALEALFSRRGLLRPLFSDLRNLRDIAILGAGFVLIQLTFFLSIDAANAGTASLMVGFVPLFVILWLAAREKRLLRAREVLCLALAMAGVALLVSKGRLSTLDFSVSGVAWGIVSAGFGAFCTLQPGSVIRRTGVRFAVGWAMTLGGAADLLFTSPFSSGARWTLESAGLYAFIVIFGTVLAFGCYLKSTSYVPASVTSLLSSFEPLTAVILTVTLLGVPFSAPEAAGAAMVIANMVILALPRKASGGEG